MVKLTERYDQLQKDLGFFWSDAPRLANRSVDWSHYSKQELDYFDLIFCFCEFVAINVYLNKSVEKILKSITKLESKGIMQDETMKIFRELNTKSVCF